MASRRLLDLYAIANASAAIARKHLLIRSHQITHYAATTSIGIGRTSRRPQPVPVRHEATPSPQGARPGGEAQALHCAPSPGPPEPSTPLPDLTALRQPAPPSPEPALRLQATYGSRIPSETADMLGQEGIPAEDLTRSLNEESFYLRHGKTPQVLSNLPRAKIPRAAETEHPKGATARINSSESMRDLPQQQTTEGLPADGGKDAIPRETMVDQSGEITEEIDSSELTRDLSHNSKPGKAMRDLPGEGEGGRVPMETVADRPEKVSGDINLSESVRKLPQQEDEEKVLEELGSQAFMSRRTRGLFGVRPGLKVPQKDAGQRNAESVSKPASKPERQQKEEEDMLNAVAEEMEREQVVVDQKEVEGIAAEVHRQMSVDKAVETPYQMAASKVPSSRMGRLFHYGGLAAGMAWGAASESVRRVAGGAGDTATSVMFSESNVERMVKKFSRMRGAALKLGQMMSFQDKFLPAPIQEVLTRVQDSADYMPAWQRDRVLASNLGPDWRDLFSEFSEVPMAAASIGQVHAGKLASNGILVAVKIQYPGVADSISSDLNNLAVLLTASRMLPKGLYLEKTIANARLELGWECDYIREAECAKRFAEILQAEKAVFRVPRIFEEASGPRVLTMEMMQGVAVTKTMKNLSQEERDFIGTQILGLCFREVARYRFMQTDPNWTNFLWNAKDKKIELLDFGASREFSAEFTDLYTSILRAASRKDLEALRTISVELGYLTGLESEAMTKAHVTSILTLAEPFSKDSPEIYDFSEQTVTDRVKAQIPLMIRERLAPPPEETYSLHRKLSGAFLLCARLRSRVRCREIFEDAVGK